MVMGRTGGRRRKVGNLRVAISRAACKSLSPSFRTSTFPSTHNGMWSGLLSSSDLVLVALEAVIPGAHGFPEV
jgi:hypothetical protein